MENLPHLILPIRTIATLIFYVFLIIYSVFTIIFYYHWQNYSMNKGATVTTFFAYFGITVPLLVLMGFTLLAI